MGNRGLFSPLCQYRQILEVLQEFLVLLNGEYYGFILAVGVSDVLGLDGRCRPHREFTFIRLIHLRFDVVMIVTSSVLRCQFRKARIGDGKRPRRSMNLAEENFVATFMTGAEPSSPPK